jgi:acetyl-CoA carboxylase / biotin carboxylase 1
MCTHTYITGVDTVERSIEFIPTKGTPYDPRHLIAGYTDVLKNSSSSTTTSSSDTSNTAAIAATTNTSGNNTTSSTNSSDTWVSGFFDRDSFCETLAGWAETVVCGRARLGGIPLGVIITESRTREKKCPADPADLTSQEKIVQQAGGVWFPDSASKTAQVPIHMYNILYQCVTRV